MNNTYTLEKMNNGLYISAQNGEVTLRVPPYLSREQIQRAIEEKKNWIINQLTELKKESIKTTEIYGKEYHIYLSYKFIHTPTLNIENENIDILLPRSYKKLNNEKALQILLDKMYFKIAKSFIETAMEKYRILLGIAPEDYKIEKMKHAIAKTSNDKIIWVHPEIIKYDKNTIEYIILHQFCHLKYRTHARGFYEMMKKNMPQYKQYEEVLLGIQY